jgi:hypothetical protein
MKNEIQISGTCKLNGETVSFHGTLTFEERRDSIYYSWKLVNKIGQLIAARSMNIAFQQIPVGQDRFEFSKAHAIQGIKTYRIRRDKIVQELSES